MTLRLHSLKIVLFGHLENTPLPYASLLLNHIILITKKYILDMKKEKILNFEYLKILFQETKKKEYIVAKNTGKLFTFYKKWEVVNLN